MFDINLVEHAYVLVGIAAVAAFFMAFNNGANDVANSFASAVGAGAIDMRQAVFIAGLMNILGATLLGGAVATKIITGVINPESAVFVNDPDAYILAMISVLLAAGTFVLFSTLTGIPVSSTHAIIGALTGASIVAAGVESVQVRTLITIAISWVVSPFLAGVLSFIVAWIIENVLIQKTGADTIRRLRIWLPYLIAVTAGVLLFSLLENAALQRMLGLKHDEEGHATDWQVLLLMALVLPYVVLVSQGALENWANRTAEDGSQAQNLFRRLQVGTSCYVAFGQGANDVANSISPVFAILIIAQYGKMPSLEEFTGQTIPLWILVLGGAGIATGVATLGGRVIRTLGERITKLSNTKGFSVDFSAATTVVTASAMQLPVSSTHAATGAIIGVGAKDDAKHLNFWLLGKIFVMWVLTVPTAGLISAGIYLLVRLIIR